MRSGVGAFWNDWRFDECFLLDVFFFFGVDEVDEDEEAACGPRGEASAREFGAQMEIRNVKIANPMIADLAGAALISLLSPNHESPQAGTSGDSAY